MGRRMGLSHNLHVLIAIAVLLVGVGGAIALDQQKRTLEAQVDVGEERIAVLHDSLDGLSDLIGYGGLIHNFKNFVLRGEERYSVRADRNAVDALRAIRILYDGPVAGGNLASVAILEEMVMSYRNRLQAVRRLRQAGMAIADIDRAVRFDDRPALNALRRISAYIQGREAALYREIARLESAAGLVNVAKYAVILSAVLTFFGLTVHWLLRKRRQAARWQGQIQALLELSPDGIACIDSTGRFVIANRIAADLFGVTQTALLDRDIGNLPALREPERLKSLVEKVASSERTAPSARIRLVVSRFHDTPVTVEASASPREVWDRPHIVVSLRDISREVVLERNLQTAARLTQEASMTKTTVMASVSHELRTPLNAIIGFSSLLIALRADSGEVSELGYLNDILSAGQELSQIVDNMLHLAQLDLARGPINWTPFDARAAAQHHLNAAKARYGRRTIDTTLTASPDSDVWRGDESMFRQICLQVFDNACRFSRPGGTVSVSLESDGRVGTMVVRDQGIGMPQEDAERVLHPFETGNLIASKGGMLASPNRVGLGLAIVNSIVRVWGGSIAIQSEPDVGTEVSIRLPLAAGASVDAGASSQDSQTEADSRFARMSLSA